LAAARQIDLCFEAFHGLASTDEYSFPRIYAAAIAANRPIYGGFSQGIMAIGLNLWYEFFGPTIASARLFSATVGLSGILLYRHLAKIEFGNFIANLGATFLCLSSYFILFSATALEVSAAFFFIPLCLLFLRHFRFRTARPLGGIFLALSLFTYPGVLYGWIALALSCVIVDHRQSFKSFCDKKNRPVIVGFSAAFLVLLAVHFHFQAPPRLYSVGAGIFRGGGHFASESWQLIDNFFSLITDTCLGGSTWYVDTLRHATFVEQALWGAFFVGAHFGWRNPKFRVLILTSSLVFFSSFFIGVNPGMRRVIAILPPIYFLCAVGFKNQRSLRGQLVLVITLLAWNGLYLAPKILRMAMPYLALPAITIPDEPLLSTLVKGDLLLDSKEFYYDMPQLAAKARREQEISFGAHKFLGEIYVGKKEEVKQTEKGRCLYMLSWEKFPSQSNAVTVFTLGPMQLSSSQVSTKPCKALE
jgi:hypothetical protein